MDLSEYLERITADADVMASAARATPRGAVPACPGWDVADLTRHLGSTHRWVTEIVGADGIARVPYPNNDAIPDSDLEGWLRDGAKRLVASLEAAGPDKSVWTMGEPRSARFWFRRQAIETALHRWDAEDASGIAPTAIDSDLAAEGLAELLEVFTPSLHRRAGTSGAGETFHIHRTDGPGEWLVRFDDGGATVTREHAKGDVALRGGAGDLLVALWRRRPYTSLDVVGNEEMLGRWEQLVPAM